MFQRRRFGLFSLIAFAAACTGGGNRQTQVVLRIERGNAPAGIDHIDFTVTEGTSVFVQTVHKKAGDPELVGPDGDVDALI